jgi:hypothetical protein
METKALRNLVFLQSKDNLLKSRYKIVANEFIDVSERLPKEEFDTVYSFKELEYPIYFTFHQLMNHVHNSYGSMFHEYTRMDLIYMMVCALDNLLDYYSDVDEVTDSFQEMLEDLDDKLYFLHQYYKYGLSYWIPTYCKEYLNSMCLRMLTTSRDIVEKMGGAFHAYSYAMYGFPVDDSDESDESAESAESAESVESEEESDNCTDDSDTCKED